MYVTQGDTIYIRDCEKLCENNLSNNSENSAVVDINTVMTAADSAVTTDNTTIDPHSDPDHLSTPVIDLSHTYTANNFNGIHATCATETIITNDSTTSCAEGTVQPTQLKAAPTNDLSSPPLFDPLFNPPPSHTAPWACSLTVCVPLRLGITSVSPEVFISMSHSQPQS